jgi:hypothetical protein
MPPVCHLGTGSPQIVEVEHILGRLVRTIQQLLKGKAWIPFGLIHVALDRPLGFQVQ